VAIELVGRKLGMTQLFKASGDCVPVTVLAVGPCVVVQKKSEEKEGYSAIQLGFEDRKQKHTTKPLQGHFAKAGVTPKRVLFECQVSAEQASGFELGAAVGVGQVFEGVKRVDVSGVTKGRGFTGVIKRHNFHQPKQTHGTHEYFRHGGSSGSGTYPGRVIKGKRMPGRYGADNVTTLALTVEKVDAERNLLFVRGAVPGHKDGLVRVRVSNRD